MKKGQRLTAVEQDIVWEKFQNDFSFHPSVRQEDWPSIQTTKPSHRFSIQHFWGDAEDHKIPQFLQKAIDAFVSITFPGEKIYGLDWQHDCFWVDPRDLTVRDMVDSQRGESLLSFLPNGDYHIFITQDFENIWFGHPWESSITLVGEKLISAFTEIA